MAKTLFVFILSWIILSNYDGIIFFSFLVLTKQITYSHLASHPKLPNVYALTFFYTPNSILKYTSPVKLGGEPLKGFNNGVFIALDSKAIAERPDILTHELRHVQQRLLWGPLFHIVYGGWNEIKQQQGYTWWEQYLSNPFEKDAYIFSGEQNHYYKLIEDHAPSLAKMQTQH